MQFLSLALALGAFYIQAAQAAPAPTEAPSLQSLALPAPPPSPPPPLAALVAVLITSTPAVTPTVGVSSIHSVEAQSRYSTHRIAQSQLLLLSPPP